MSDISREQRYVGLSIFFLLLLNFPVLGLMDKGASWFSIPIVIYYIAGVWLLAIVFVGLWINRKSGPWKNR